ncbi:hypothetical protein K3495_g6372 [Podosphaera aphanis]|nr:hypothetical protein K3495_g6372 [Podosphaera aphanis]
MLVSLDTLLVVPFAIYVLQSIHPHISKLSLTVVLGFLHALANYWEGLVTKIVPEPYLDEVFHIPQAQAYCDHKYDVWDPKITTPPGLYVVASLRDFVLHGLERKSTSCSVHALRSLNGLLLALTLIFAYACRIEITRCWNQAREPAQDALHTAFNIALFPPLFFFSGLFYSDVLSTCSLLVGYKLYLTRRGSRNVIKSYNQLWIYIFGIISLTIRQTNIFWFLGLLGASELRHVFPPKNSSNQVAGAQDTWPQVVWTRLKQAADGKIYDVGVDEARIQDFLLCASSIAISAISRPYNVIISLWPYIALLLSFTSFVYWNGGVVLGNTITSLEQVNLLTIKGTK